MRLLAFWYLLFFLTLLVVDWSRFVWKSDAEVAEMIARRNTVTVVRAEASFGILLAVWGVMATFRLRQED